MGFPYSILYYTTSLIHILQCTITISNRMHAISTSHTYMFLQIYLIIILYIYYQHIDPCLSFLSNPLKTQHTTLQHHTSPTCPIRTQPYSTCCATPFHNNRADTMHTWERIHTSLKLSSTYNRPHLVSDGLPRYSCQSLLLDNAHIHSQPIWPDALDFPKPTSLVSRHFILLMYL